MVTITTVTDVGGRFLVLVILCCLTGLTLFGMAALQDKPSPSPLAGGVVVLLPSRSQPSFSSIVGNLQTSPETAVLPVRFIGEYQTKAPKGFQRRLLTVLVGDAKVLRQIFPTDKPLPITFLGEGVPKAFKPSELAGWRRELPPLTQGAIFYLPPYARALKWTVLFVVEKPFQGGHPALFVLSPYPLMSSVQSLTDQLGQPLAASVRTALRPSTAFWMAWVGMVLLFLGGHLFLWQAWQRWKHRPSVAVLMRERWLYHSIAAVYFSLYLTAVGVVYNRPDFQDALQIPLHFIAPSQHLILFSPLTWLWNWSVQVVAVMLPSALLPPAGIVIGHMRGMVEQALTTAPIAQGSHIGGIVTALAVFWQGEATVVAMVWSGLLTRAITAPHTFGTDSYWQAYKVAFSDFLPLVKLVGVLTAMATVLGMLA